MATKGDLMGSVTRGSPVAMEETDAALIRRMHGDPALFETVFHRYYVEIHGYVSRRLGRDLADDVAAETFLVAFNRWERYDTSHDWARPWLLGIACNLIARHQRAEARRYRALARADGALAEGPAEGHADQVAARLDAQAVRGRLAQALGDIAPPDREVLLLVAWAGLTGEETARALDIPPGTVRSRLHRARTRLRAALGGADPTAVGDDFDD
jgi:RNA polymerase sigma factor (sigma-70 family)